MRLNTIAGRTYNDMTQYPVFPWILNDYVSDRIDLHDVNIYRDLSKPIGALNPERLTELKERYDMWEDPTDSGVPAFLYGTHYSNVGSVLYFLTRMEPYTAHMVDLQSGALDQPDRMFHSFEECWQGVMNNSSDLKELIPELFYMPSILKNTNELDLGTRENGTVLNDIDLPVREKELFFSSPSSLLLLLIFFFLYLDMKKCYFFLMLLTWTTVVCFIFSPSLSLSLSCCCCCRFPPIPLLPSVISLLFLAVVPW